MEAIFNPIDEACERIQFAKRLYLADIEAMSDTSLASTGGGTSRCGFDVTYELAGMYSTFADLLANSAGEIVGPKGWVRAPEEFKSKGAASSAFEGSLDKFVNAFQGYKGDVLADQFESPAGPFTPLGMANLAVWHTMYHSGQLNYIQTIHGDDQFHWM